MKAEINDASFLSIMLDETTDTRNLSQLSTVIRYCKDGEVKERFLGFEDVSGGRTAEDLLKIVEKTMEDFNCEEKLIG